MFMFLNTSSLWPLKPREIYNTTIILQKLMSIPEIRKWWIVLLILVAVLILSCLSVCCWCVCRSRKGKVRAKSGDSHAAIKYSKLQLLGNPVKAKVQPDVVKLGKITKREFKVNT